MQGGRAVNDYSEVFVGMDVSKARIAVGLADGGGAGQARFLGEIEASEASVTKLVRRLSSKHGKLTFCYEAGPTGYGLYRLIGELGHECRVVAPSLIPRKPGDRVKTNRRDALSLARLLRAGELTAVWTPDERHEAMRDLVRARSAAAFDLRVKRQQTGAFLLRLGRVYPGKKTWGGAHRKWLASQAFAHLEQRIAFEELVAAMDEAKARVARLEKAIEEAVPDWSLEPTVTALMAMRGIDLVAATTILAEVGDLGRFPSPRELMAWLGLVPSEASTGDRVRRFGITKAGNGRARKALIEAAWCYRYPARIGQAKLARVEAAPPAARRIAWKAQTRLTARYRALMRKGKLKTVAVTAIARELAGFVWAIHRALEKDEVVA
jgi:transposase